MQLVDSFMDEETSSDNKVDSKRVRDDVRR